MPAQRDDIDNRTIQLTLKQILHNISVLSESINKLRGQIQPHQDEMPATETQLELDLSSKKTEQHLDRINKKKYQATTEQLTSSRAAVH